MKTKGRPKSKNIEDRRVPKKIRNNNDVVAIPFKDGSYGGQTDKGIFKMRDFSSQSIQPKGKKKSKYKKGKLTANSSSKKRMSKAR
jgi:hypothetical protein